MLNLAIKNLSRRRIRTALCLLGLAMSVAVLACLMSFGEGYESSLHSELDRMGMQLMLVPLGCPYDAAARVLKGKSLDVTFPQAALAAARSDSAVAIAAPMFSAAIPRREQGRTDLWVGIDQSTPALKSWWKLTPGSHWFTGPDDVLLGSEAAATELRSPGDHFYSPETGRTFTVCGVLERTGASDDSQFFVPLATAQTMFHQPGRLTAGAIRLKDPTLLEEAQDRLQNLKGVQVVTLTEMMGAFLTLLRSGRMLVVAITLVAVVIGGLSVFNTMTAAVLDRTVELGVMRAVGYSRARMFGLMLWEALLITLMGGALGLVTALLFGPVLGMAIRPFVPFASETALPALTAHAVGNCIGLSLIVGLTAGLYPAWQAGRLSPMAALRMEA